MHGIGRRRFASVLGAALLTFGLLPGSVLAVVGPATHLVFGVQPSTTVAGGTISPSVTVMVEDAGGSVVTTDSSSVTLAIGTNPAGGTLSGTATQAASSGIATFSDLSINNPGIGYTLQATDGSLTAATSASFTILGPATHLVFGVQPSTTAAGGTISPSVTVLVEDAGGSVVSSSASVTLAIGTNPGGGTLSGTLTRAASGGVATFNDLSINNAGFGYTLSATSSPLTGATSSSFTVVGPATHLVFGVQPSTTAAGGTISPSVTVMVEDAGGSVVTTDSSSVTLAIGTNPGAGTLSGTLTRAASAGVATFNDLSINNAGVGYTLHATDGSLTAMNSASFTILGPATHLVFGVQPSTTAAGATIGPAVTVMVEDAGGNVVTTDSSSVTLAIGTNPSGGTLSGTLTRAASAGVATFNNLSINNPGVGYTLHATDGSLTPANSASFTVTGSNHLVFAVQPGGGAAGVAWSQQPVVEVLNSLNQVVTTDNSTHVSLSISTNPAGGTLSCATSGTYVQVVAGVATFAGCSINVASTSAYTLGATSAPAWIPATSNPFYIGSTSEQLLFVTQPGGGAAGAVWSQQPVVDVVNSLNQVVTTDNSTIVYLAISTNPAGGTLSCTSGTAVTVVNGVASFYGCSINVGSSSYYTLGASSSPVWTLATSSPFYIGGSSESLLFATQPGGGVAGAAWAQQPKVEVVNSLNQVVTTDNSTIVYLGISINPAGGALSCTSGTSATVFNGVASFYGCSINVASTSYYTLGATSSPSWTAATSNAFYVTGARSSLAISASSALGLKPQSGFSTKTPKVQARGKYVTWEFMGGSVLAGQRVNVLVARKSAGVWGSPAYLKSAWADANGVVTFAWTSRTTAAVNVRVQWPGSATYMASTSKALGAYWQ